MKKTLTAAAITALWAGAAIAGSWTLDADASRLAFGSIKKDKVGEVHAFTGLSGAVSAEGTVNIDIDLSSVETNIDIRNERMIEHVFKRAGAANLAAAIDLDALEGLAVGASDVIDVEGVLNLLGQVVEIEAEIFVMRVAKDRALVTTNDMIFLGTEEAGIDGGIDKLMALAKLPGITRTAPVTLRLVFTADDQAAATDSARGGATVAAVAVGDAAAGKKVFKKCKACHTVKPGDNKVGPTLHGLLGRRVAAVEGFKYSKAFKALEGEWTAETLSAFLANPKTFAPGNKMSFRGLKKEDDIANLIAYLAEG